jgi:hypothetical protein
MLKIAKVFFNDAERVSRIATGRTWKWNVTSTAIKRVPLFGGHTNLHTAKFQFDSFG